MQLGNNKGASNQGNDTRGSQTELKAQIPIKIKQKIKHGK